ncbi:unnamed protein product, partial [Allacma fusca]
MGNSFNKTFLDDGQKIMDRVLSCILQSLAPSNKRETFKHVGCRSKAYKEVCGHNT